MSDLVFDGFCSLFPHLAHVFQELTSQASIGQILRTPWYTLHVLAYAAPCSPIYAPAPLPMNAHIDTAASAHLWDTGLRVLDSFFRCRCSPTRPGSHYSNLFGMHL